MASTNVSYLGDGSTTLFAIGFPYLSPSHVVVTLDGVATTDFTFPTSASIQFTVAPTAGQAIYIHRVTPQTPLVDFVDGSTLTEALLDTATNQAIYIAQEAYEGVTTSQSLADAVTAAVVGGNLASIKAAEAVVSASQAATSETNAYLSALASAASAGSMVLASQAEAEAGVENTKFLSSLRVKQAITANVSSSFPSGTRISFNQTSAPTGWTKDTRAGLNDSILRIVTGAVSSGGSTAFSTFNGQTSVEATTLTSSQIPTLNLEAWSFTTGGGTGKGTVPSVTDDSIGVLTSNASWKTVQSSPSLGSLRVAGGNGSHTHGITTSIKYNDFIIARKD